MLNKAKPFSKTVLVVKKPKVKKEKLISEFPLKLLFLRKINNIFKIL